MVKSIIPQGQGRNLTNTMDLYLTNLLDRGEQINLPAIMIAIFSGLETRLGNTIWGMVFSWLQCLSTLGTPVEEG